MKMVTKEEVEDALKQVEDPELGIDIWTLGLIYGINIEDNKIKIKMTFTTPMCPYGPILVDEVKTKLEAKGAKEVDVEIVFEPPWEPSEELRAILGV